MLDGSAIEGECLKLHPELSLCVLMSGGLVCVCKLCLLSFRTGGFKAPFASLNLPQKVAVAVVNI